MHSHARKKDQINKNYGENLENVIDLFPGKLIPKTRFFLWFYFSFIYLLSRNKLFRLDEYQETRINRNLWKKARINWLRIFVNDLISLFRLRLLVMALTVTTIFMVLLNLFISFDKSCYCTNLIKINKKCNITYNYSLALLNNTSISNTLKCAIICQHLNCSSITRMDESCTIKNPNTSRINLIYGINMKISYKFGTYQQNKINSKKKVVFILIFEFN